MRTMLLYCMLVCLTSVGTAISQTTETVNSVATMTNVSALRSIIATRRGQEVAAAAQNRIGRIFYAEKNDSAAENEFLMTYTQYQNQRAEATQAGYYLGKISLNDGNPRQALKYLSKSVSSGNLAGGEADWARYYRVKAMYRADDPAYLTTLQKYLASNHEYSRKNDVSLRYDLIRYFMDNHQYDRALAEADTVVNLFPNSPLSMKVNFQIGELYYLLGKSQEALNQFTSIYNNAGQNAVLKAHALYQIGVAYDNQSNLTEARSTYQKVISTYPGQTRWVNASEFGIAMIEYREAATKNGSSLDAAYNALHSFVSKYPSDHHVPQALMALANLCTEQGKYSEAVDDYNQVIQFDSSLIPIKPKAAKRSNDVKAFRQLVLRSHFAKAMLLRMRMSEPDQALAEYNLILSTHPGNIEALFCKALCLVDLNRKDEARTILNNLSSSGTAYGKMAQQTLATL